MSRATVCFLLLAAVLAFSVTAFADITVTILGVVPTDGRIGERRMFGFGVGVSPSVCRRQRRARRVERVWLT